MYEGTIPFPEYFLSTNLILCTLEDNTINQKLNKKKGKKIFTIKNNKFWIK